MVFSSLVFMFRFLPVFLILYYLTPAKFRNFVLLAGSLVFYAYGEAYRILLLLFSILFTFFIGIQIDKSREDLIPIKNKSFPWFGLGIFYNLGLLIFFKYTNFIIENINLIIRLVERKWLHFGEIYQIPELSLTLPLGISFFTFELIAYLIQIKRGKIKAEVSLPQFACYACMFPQLLSGPIVLYEDIIGSIKSRKYDISYFEEGLETFVIGLGSKVLLADKLSSLWNDIQTIGFASISMPLAWMGAFAYAMEIYFDFNGYSLMAIGVGKMLGFRLPDNFNQPYSAKSVTDFWRRWHMTLTGWFREFIYIPLGGNRVGFFKMIRNILIVWLVTGLWHGASWNFVLWGLTLFFILLVEKLFLKKLLDKSRFISRLYVIILIPVTWIMFAITDLDDLFIYLERLFTFQNTNTYSNVFFNDFDYFRGLYGGLFLLCVFFASSLPSMLFKRIRNKLPGYLILLVIFWISVYEITISTNNPFMYFRF